MKKTFACAIRPNKAPSMRCGLSIISLEHSYGLNGSRIFDRTQLAPKCPGTVGIKRINVWKSVKCFVKCFMASWKKNHIKIIYSKTTNEKNLDFNGCLLFLDFRAIQIHCNDFCKVQCTLVPTVSGQRCGSITTHSCVLDQLLTIRDNSPKYKKYKLIHEIHYCFYLLVFLLLMIINIT